MVKVSAPALHVSEGGKGDILLFPGARALGVTAPGNTSLTLIWQKNPLRAGHRAGVIKRSCPPRKAASKLQYRTYFRRLDFVFNWLCWSDPCYLKASLRLEKTIKNKTRSRKVFLFKRSYSPNRNAMTAFILPLCTDLSRSMNG